MIYEIKLVYSPVVLGVGEAKSRNHAGKKFCDKYKYTEISRFSHSKNCSTFTAKSVTGEHREFVVSELILDF